MTDIPRPAGRRWAGRLRRSGSLARQVLLVGRITRRRRDGTVGAPGLAVALEELDPPAPGSSQMTSIGRIRPPRGEPILPTPVSPVLAPSRGGPPKAPLSIPLLPGDRTLSRRLRFAVVNGCTLASLVLGVTAIFLAVSSANIRLAALCVIGCVAFDGLDGAMARRLGVASPFGAQMDSLADMCSFGIAAPVVVYGWLSGLAPVGLVAPACVLVAVCAAIRLARFNVSPKDGRFFCGVPTTMAAAVLAIGALIETGIPVPLRIAGVAVLALAMVSSFPYAKFARVLRLPTWLLAVPVIGAFVDYQLTFALLVLGYLVSGPLIWARQRRATVPAAV